MKNRNFIILFLLSLLIAGAVYGNGTQEDSPSSANNPSSAKTPSPANTSSVKYWNGEGGRGIRLAVLEPTGRGLSAGEQWLLSMIQGSITGDFQKYSAMTIIDRQNLEKILGEQRQSLSGNYSDDDYVRIGKLTNARYILTGSVTKTASAFMLDFAVTDAESGERKASYPPKAVSPLALENLSAVKEATAELLKQLGVQLTNSGLQELSSTANTAQVKAETALAKGIEAQRQGTVVEALSYYIQAANYNTGLAEAASRMNILNANITSGNIGADTRTDIAWRREWVARLQETETFFSNSLKAPQPFYIVYSTDIKQGKIDYQKETTDLSIWMGFYPDYVWADQINQVVTSVKSGLQATGRASVWELDWTAKSVSSPNPFANQTKNATSTVVVEIINSEGRSIGRQTVRSPYGFEVRNAAVAPSWQWEGDVTFTGVNANLITDRLEIKITTIDGTAAETAARQKNISVMPLTEWEAMMRTQTALRQKIETVKAEIAAREREAQAQLQREQEAARAQAKLGHVYSVAFSPDGKQFISGEGSSDNTIKLWDTATGRLIRTFYGHINDYVYSVISVAFSPDGKQIVSGSTDNTIKLWDASTGRIIRTFSAQRGAWSVVFSPDGRQILSGLGDDTIKLWDASTGSLIRTFSSGTIFTVYSVAFSPDGRQIISGSGSDKTIKLWDVSTGRLIRTFSSNTNTVHIIAFSPDGRQIVSCSFDDSTIKLWDVSTGSLIRMFSGHTNSVMSVAFSPDGRQILSGSGSNTVLGDNTIKLWDVATGRLIRTFPGHLKRVSSVAFSPDGRQILSSSGADSGSTIKLWDISTGSLIYTIGTEK